MMLIGSVKTRRDPGACGVLPEGFGCGFMAGSKVFHRRPVMCRELRRLPSGRGVRPCNGCCWLLVGVMMGSFAPHRRLIHASWIGNTPTSHLFTFAVLYGFRADCWVSVLLPIVA